MHQVSSASRAEVPRFSRLWGGPAGNLSPPSRRLSQNAELTVRGRCHKSHFRRVRGWSRRCRSGKQVGNLRTSKKLRGSRAALAVLASLLLVRASASHGWCWLCAVLLSTRATITVLVQCCSCSHGVALCGARPVLVRQHPSPQITGATTLVVGFVARGAVSLRLGGDERFALWESCPGSWPFLQGGPCRGHKPRPGGCPRLCAGRGASPWLIEHAGWFSPRGSELFARFP
jgi:hypothetical protein